MESTPTVFDIFDCQKATIEKPADGDILCGKDKTYNLHPGNLRFRQLIEENGVHYAESGSKQGKMKITKAIVDAVQKSGARFLEKTDGSWTQVANAKARDKTSHALRFYCKQYLTKQNLVTVCVTNSEKKKEVEATAGKHIRKVSDEGMVLKSASDTATSYDSIMAGFAEDFLKSASDTATSTDSILREFAEVYANSERSSSMDAELYTDTIRSIGSMKDANMDTWRSRDTQDFNLDTLRSQDLRDIMDCVSTGDTDEVMGMAMVASM